MIGADFSSMACGGVNATDALMIARHFVSEDSLDLLAQQAADVDGSGYINSTDALFAMQYFAGLFSQFPSLQSWVLGGGTIEVTSSSGATNLLLPALCTGDVDGSFTPCAKGGEQKVSIHPGDEMEKPEPSQEFSVSLLAGHSFSMAAASLTLSVSGDAEVTGVALAGSFEPVIWHQDGNVLKIAWYSLNPSIYGEGQAVLTVRLRGEVSAGLPLWVSGESECAGTDGKVLEGVVLLSPVIRELSSADILSIYPNPCRHHANLILRSGRAAENLLIEVRDISGRTLRTIEMSCAAETSQELKLDLSGFSAGSYMVVVRSAATAEWLGSQQLLIAR